MCVCVCVCVCVCARALSLSHTHTKERERVTGERRSVFHSVHLNVSKATIITAILLVASRQATDRKNTLRKGTASLAGKLPPYPREITQRRKIFIGLKPVFVLRKQVCWIDVPRVWVNIF